MEFSEKLKELRSEKGISQAKLAVDIHISRSAVAKWENGLELSLFCLVSSICAEISALSIGITAVKSRKKTKRHIAWLWDLVL